MVVWRTAVLLLSLIAAVACGRDTSSAEPATSSAVAARANFDQIEGEFPTQSAGVPGAQSAPVGACVSLTGPKSSPALSVVDCGSPSNGYRVIQRVSGPDECVKDADQRFYLNPAEGQWTASLDYAWSNKDCLSISDITAVHTPCDGAAPGRERPIQVVLDAISTANCPTGGFAHPVRRFTICTHTQ